MQKCDFNKVSWQKLRHKSAFLGMSTSLDGVKIKFITMLLKSVSKNWQLAHFCL